MQKEVEEGLRGLVEAGKPPKAKALQARQVLWEGQVPQLGVAGAQGEAGLLPQPAHQTNCGLAVEKVEVAPDSEGEARPLASPGSQLH